MAVDALPWGNTCPLLKIAQFYKVPYELPLHLADMLQHNRPGAAERAFDAGVKVPVETIAMVQQDVRYLSQWMAGTRDGHNPDFPKDPK